ncbi:Glycosyltransferase involved in cell wall bisynthesis [Pseudooceanicola antarcticus]|uniref:Glycosyltransferase involved in cell wall bisynthesis n=1 Tax=Pseudooceanicola antarcticus TaxID=1247613 RepID=A0A285HRM0_9RHOB|nr:Glycosyltransferase involved in cell wall bisynthesis [Pseudooceanicola antarcticus]
MAQDRIISEVSRGADGGPPGPPPRPGPWRRYRQRLLRRRLLWRAFRARHALSPLSDRTDGISDGEVLLFVCLRNEALRLPYFMSHYRSLGVSHFLVVDNGSQDGSAEWMADQGDVSIWRTGRSYRAARFGMDWLGWLLMRHGHGHWCLTVDADELLVTPGMESLPRLTRRLEVAGRPAMGALMLDLLPEAPLGQGIYQPGEDPVQLLTHFDPGPFRARWQARHGNLWLQGGSRDRVFFAETPERAPTLNKLPLVRWNRRYAYLNSTHSLLPARLNALYSGPEGDDPSGVLLHTKFLPDSPSRAREERSRREHFGAPEDFDDYYRAVAAGAQMLSPASLRYESPEQLEYLGLMQALKLP